MAESSITELVTPDPSNTEPGSPSTDVEPSILKLMDNDYGEFDPFADAKEHAKPVPEHVRERHESPDTTVAINPELLPPGVVMKEPGKNNNSGIENQTPGDVAEVVADATVIARDNLDNLPPIERTI